MVTVFCGYDARESIGFHVFVSSLIRHASEPVRVVPLASAGLAQGSNAFTLSRFLVPHLMGYRGRAIFVDASDMLMQADIVELDRLFDPSRAVQVVPHQAYQTQHPVKYRGTAMEAQNLPYLRKNWASVMLINCEHMAWLPVERTLRFGRESNLHWLQLRHLMGVSIGGLPDEWNRLVDEGQPVEGAKILHWTAGIPAFTAYRDAPGADLWRAARACMEQAG
jgi:hypothetical protein